MVGHVPIDGCMTPRSTSVSAQAAIAGSLTDGSIGDADECLKAHVSQRDRPLVAGFEHSRADWADNGVVVGEDAHPLGAALDLPVLHARGVRAGDLGQVLPRKIHAGEHVVAGGGHGIAEPLPRAPASRERDPLRRSSPSARAGSLLLVPEVPRAASYTIIRA